MTDMAALGIQHASAPVVQSLLQFLMSEVCCGTVLAALQTYLLTRSLDNDRVQSAVETEEGEISGECRSKSLEPVLSPEVGHRVPRKDYAGWVMTANNDDDDDDEDEDDDEDDGEDEDDADSDEEDGGEDEGEGEDGGENEEGDDDEDKDDEEDDEDDDDDDEDEEEEDEDEDEEEESPPKKLRK